MPQKTMSADGDGWIEIFRAGDYRDQGKARITREDLERVVRGYDPQFHEAPVCIGHPEHNLPAYAWVDRLALRGDTLLAKEKQVDPDFAEMRKNGKFKKRSAAFYRDAAGNITGLRHVGWLGAQPPAVKGLKDANFEDAGREFIAFEFGEENAMAEDQKLTFAEWWQKFTEKFTGSAAPAATSFSEAQVQKMIDAAVSGVKAEMQSKVTTLETQIAEQKTAFAEREKKLVAGEHSQRVTEIITGLKSKGAWVPAFDKAGLALVFDELAKGTTSVEFGEADASGKKPQVAPLQILVTFMEGLGRIVPAGQHYKPGQAAPAAQGGKGRTGDPLTDAALARAADKKITYGEALDQIVLEQPELANAGASAAASV